MEPQKIIPQTTDKEFFFQWALAKKYLSDGLYDEALKIFESLSEEFLDAMVEVGNIYEYANNQTLKQDFSKAYFWYKKAIDESDDPYAYVGLARLILKGYVEAGSINDAIQYLKLASDKNNPIAYIILGFLYHQGNLIEKNLEYAKDLYQNAINLGYARPINLLAKICFEERHYWTWLKLKVKTFCHAFKLAWNDKNDPRLQDYLIELNL